MSTGSDRVAHRKTRSEHRRINCGLLALSAIIAASMTACPGGTSGSATSCPEREWIGVRTSTGAAVLCPNIPDPSGQQWIGENLFDTRVPAAMQKYCRYTWSSPVQVPPASAKSVLTAGFDGTIQPDCVVASPLNASHDDLVWPDLSANYLQRAWGTSELSLATNTSTRVRVAVVDTAESSYDLDGLVDNGLSGTHPHGRAVALAIRSVAGCRDIDEECPVRLSSEQALGRLHHGPKDGTGGVGTIGDVAIAIQRAIREYETAASPDHLIINLSLGWSFHESDPAAAAVRDIIRSAACKGYLVVAAAGNASGGASPELGPVYPAAWESSEPLDCAQLGIVSSSTAGPMLYAAAGLDNNDEYLIESRPGAHPRFAAPANQAVVADGDGHTPVLTGSSMASAVVSGVAALAWTINPDLGRREMMELVYAKSFELPQTGPTLYAEFGVGADVYPVKRVDACTVVRSLCAPNSPCPVRMDACSAVGSPLAWTPPATYNPPQVPIVGSAVQTITACTPNTCPDKIFRAAVAEPAVVPQPNCDPCPSCILKLLPQQTGATTKQMTLLGSISADCARFQLPATFTNGTISLFGSDLTNPILIDASGAQFQTQSSFTLTVEVPAAMNVKAAKIGFKVQPQGMGEYSGTSQVGMLAP